MNQKEILYIIGLFITVIGFASLLAGIEIWTVLGATRVVFTDLAYLGILMFVFGIIIIIAGLIIQPKRIEENYLACPYCGSAIHPDFLKCPNCGALLKKKCNNCGNLVDVRAYYCPFCGNDQFIPPPDLTSNEKPL
jgi:RNA polymerase subunit RPABC4/transcription elongation factor Spt4